MPTPLPLPDRISRNSSLNPIYATNSLFIEFTDSKPRNKNPKIDIWDIIWENLTLDNKNLVESVLKSVGSWGVLSWIPAYETEMKYFKLTSKGFSLSHTGGNNSFVIACSLEQTFDNV